MEQDAIAKNFNRFVARAHYLSCCLLSGWTVVPRLFCSLFTALYRHTNQSNMWTIREFAVSFVALALMGVAEGQEWNVVEAVISDIPSTNAVELTCIFDNDWSEATHPIDYPGTDAHWSPMVLAAHSDQYLMWANGTLASNGIVSVAEVCRNHILLSRSQQTNA